MKSPRFGKKIILPILISAVFFVCAHAAMAQPQALPLEVSDCNKCHIGIVTKVFNLGGMHKEALDCLGCHMEHAPEGAETIPDCSMCHDQSDHPHFGINNCVGCHNPHAPLEIDLLGVKSVRQACATCHEEPNSQFELYPSSHSDMDCNGCHQEHGEAFSCLDCHEAHSDKIAEYKDCLTCHQPHMPTVVRYPDNLSVSYCSACHESEAADLRSSNLKHSTFNCTFCHRVQHKSVPDCGTCHGYPHKPSLHNRFPDCKECHNSAHILEK